MHRDHKRSGSGVTPLTFSPSLADVQFSGSTPTHRASWASPSVFSTMKWGFLPSVMFHLASLRPSGSRSKSGAAGMASSQQTDGGFRSGTRGCCTLPITRRKSSQIWSLFLQQASALNPCSLSCSAEQDWTREKASSLLCSKLFRKASHLP